MCSSAFAYDFSAVSPSGQTLYYTITNGEAQITSQNTSYPYYSTYPTGNLIIPESITNDGTTYSITSIFHRAFYDCNGLTSVIIPNSVTSIGIFAFHGCTGLTSITIPNSVASIGDGAFRGCRELASIVVEIGNTVYDSRNNSNAIIETSNNSLLYGCKNSTIPNSVTSISNWAFYDCSGLTTIIIPNSVTYIDEWAFGDCTDLTTITIPNSVTSIGRDAFYNCRSICVLSIPNSVTSIGSDAFYRVKNIVYSGSATGSPWGANCTSNDFVQEDIFIFKNAAKDYLIGCCGSAEGAVSIPSTVNTIGQYAFLECTEMTSIDIPNSVTTIGEAAFRGCAGLTSITIPPSVSYIGQSCFRDCSNLTTVYFNATECVMQPSGDYFSVFGYPCALNTLIIGDNVRIIPSYAFADCNNLASVSIGASVSSIGESAFAGCRLSSVVIPNTVTHIAKNAFYGNSSMTSLVLGNSVNTIGYEAFYNCRGLLEIHCNATVPPTLGSDVFKNVAPGIPVYVPCERIPLYSYNWSYFSNFIETPPFILNVSSSDIQMGSARVTESPTCSNPMAEVTAFANSGYRFDHWSNGSTYNPLSIAIVEDTELIANFVPDSGPNGIDDISSTDGMKVYTRGNTIVIDFSGQQAAGSKQSIIVCDVMGRVVKLAAGSGQQAAVEIPVTSAGVYMVKVGERPSRKVIVKP